MDLPTQREQNSRFSRHNGLAKGFALDIPAGYGSQGCQKTRGPKPPEFEGRPIRVEYRKGLSAWRGQLLSEDERGEAVHAGADLRRRLIVLDDSLRRMPRQHARILCHEYFHFVWWRAGNPTRFSYEALLRRELSAHARGETGWSADWRKRELPAGNSRLRTRRWREYVCESFCDTGASLYGWRGSECTLARRHFDARRRWFDDYVASRGGRLPV